MPSKDVVHVRPAVEQLLALKCRKPSHPEKNWEGPKSSCVECVTTFVGAVVEVATKKAARGARRDFGRRLAKRMCLRCSGYEEVVGVRSVIGRPEFLHLEDGEAHKCDASLVWELLGYHE